MSDVFYHGFVSGARHAAVLLPFELERAWQDLEIVRRNMIKTPHPSFTRDEWAYLIDFIGRRSLEGVFVTSFGDRTSSADPLRDASVIAKPRGEIAMWLPANVSLLGPLCVIQLLLTGNRMRVKASSGATDLTAPFTEYLKERLPAGAFRDHVNRSLEHEIFDRADPRNATWASTADVRIVFGSDAAATAIEQLSHPISSTGVAFSDRRSEAWLHRDDCSDQLLRDLIKVFAIYGQAGCTSPSRLAIVDGSASEALEVAERLTALWKSTVPAAIPPAHASKNVLAWQHALATGVNAMLVPDAGAVVTVSSADALPTPYPHLLAVTYGDEEALMETAPPNLQTLGLSPTLLHDSRFLGRLAASRAVRLVPVARMHHFGSIWDGRRFWSECFTFVEVMR